MRRLILAISLLAYTPLAADKYTYDDVIDELNAMIILVDKEVNSWERMQYEIDEDYFYMLGLLDGFRLSKNLFECVGHQK